MKVKTKKIYAFYKGDKFADVGDAEELGEPLEHLDGYGQMDGHASG